MQKRGKRQAQASMEYLMVVGLVFVIIVPMVYVFYSYSTEMSEQVVLSKVEKIAGDIVNSAEEVFYLGEPSKTTVKFDMPPTVIDAYTSPDKRELVFKVGDEYKFKEVVAYSNVNLVSYLVPPDLVPGKRSVRVEAMANHAVVYTGNITYARARWCAYGIARQIISPSIVAYTTQISRYAKVTITADCKPDDIIIDGNKIVIEYTDENGNPAEVSVDSIVPLEEESDGVVLSDAGEYYYDFVYTASGIIIGLPTCRDEDKDGYGKVFGSPECEWDCDDTLDYVHPGPDATEICLNSIDDDCDGYIDGKDLDSTCLRCIDADKDGYGAGSERADCTYPDLEDCDDNMGDDPADCPLIIFSCNALNSRCAICIHPTAAEFCNTLDDDCDGTTDEGFVFLTDPNNCGSCGNVCSGGKTCQNYVCTCPSTLPNECSGVCVDLNSNLNNCGGCGIVCSLPGSTATCNLGSCNIGGCAANYADCNALIPGCEVYLLTDANNCGTCSKICVPNNRLNGVCAAGACDLVMYHTFNYTEKIGRVTIDNSSYRNDGTVIGTAPLYLTTWVIDGYVGKAYTFTNNINSYIKVPDHSSLDIADEMTITAKFNAQTGTISAGSIGIYPGTATASSDIKSFVAIAKVSDYVYAVAYSDFYVAGSLKAFVRTVKLNPDGSIYNALVDRQSFGTQSKNTDIIHASVDIYAVAYTYFNTASSPMRDELAIATLQIDQYGNIADSLRGWALVGQGGYYPDIIQVSGEIFAVAFTNSSPSDYGGYIHTMQISSDGSSITSINMFKFESVYGWYPSIVSLGGDKYAIAYQGPDNDGFIKIIQISSDGQTISVVNTFEFDTESGLDPEIVHVSGNIYAIAYIYQVGISTTYESHIKTVEILPADWSITSKYNLVTGSTNLIGHPHITHHSGDVYAHLMGTSASMFTVKIDSSGQFSDNSASVNVGASTTDAYPSFVHAFGENYLVSRGNNPSGDIIPVKVIVHEPGKMNIYKEGAYGIHLDSTGAYGTINTRTIGPVSANLNPTGWNYIALTYNKNLPSDNMKLYINNNDPLTLTFSEPINTNSNDLFIGRFYKGTVDEVTVYRRALSKDEIGKIT